MDEIVNELLEFDKIDIDRILASVLEYSRLIACDTGERRHTKIINIIVRRKKV